MKKYIEKIIAEVLTYKESAYVSLYCAQLALDVKINFNKTTKKLSVTPDTATIGPFLCSICLDEKEPERLIFRKIYGEKQ